MENGVNLYSSGEDLLAKSIGEVPFPGLEKLWVNQEMQKGRPELGLLGAVSEGGWGFNSFYGLSSPDEANAIDPNFLRGISFFSPFELLGLYDLDDGSDFLLDGNDNVRESEIYRRLMADAIPALSNPTGGNGNFDTAVFHAIGDLMQYRRNGGQYVAGNWPRSHERWLHSDIKVVAYPFNFGAFDAIVHYMNHGSLE